MSALLSSLTRSPSSLQFTANPVNCWQHCHDKRKTLSPSLYPSLFAEFIRLYYYQCICPIRFSDHVSCIVQILFQYFWTIHENSSSNWREQNVEEDLSIKVILNIMMTIILGRLGCMQCTGQEGRTPHAPHAGRSNAPKYTARHSSALHWQAVGCLSTWNIFRTSIFHALFCICVCTILVLYLYGMCWGSSVGAIKICHLIMALPDPAESQQWGLDWTRWWCAQCGNKLRINKPPLANNTFSWSWQFHAVPQYLRKGQL